MRWLRACALVTALAACVPAYKQMPHDVPYQRVAPPELHAMPQPFRPSDWWDQALHSTVRPLARAVSPARYLSALTEGRPALDVNAFGQVPDSPWFENRIGRALMTPADVARGPNRLEGPADGELVVVSGKPEGVLPGLVLRDVDGTVWFVKFDPPSYPGMASAAEMVGSRVLHAAGYRVPETYLVELDLDRLRLDPAATTRDGYNREVPLTGASLRVLVMLLNPDRDGRLRAVFSRAVPGRALGPFAYRGVRPDDPNDRIPHERRRSLRGLWVFQAWLNNTDTRRQNSLDSFVPVSDDGALGYVHHYLIDFGDALGAAGDREKLPSEGYEGMLSWRDLGKRALALGLLYPDWLAVRRSPYRSVGIFDADVFDPATWAPAFPNPAFEESTAADSFWAASILARFDEARVRAAVDTAGYAHRAAADWVVSVLMRRRAKLLRYVFGGVAPLDHARVEDGHVVELTDLERMAQIDVVRSRRYRYAVIWERTGRSDLGLDGGVANSPRFDLRDTVTRVMSHDPGGFRDDPFLTLSIRVERGGGPLSPPVHVRLRVVRDHLLPVAIDREW